MKKIHISETSLLGIVTFFCVALLSYWAVDPEIRFVRDAGGNPTETKTVVFRALPVKHVQTRIISAVQPGEEAKYHTKVIRERACPSRVERIIVDGTKFRTVLPDQDFNTAPGREGFDEFTTGIATHPNSAPGPALLTTIVTWFCNPMDKVIRRVAVLETPFVFEEKSLRTSAENTENAPRVCMNANNMLTRGRSFP